jgi:hypothetical protein
LSTVKKDNIDTIDLTEDAVDEKLNRVSLDKLLIKTVKHYNLNPGVSPRALQV